MNNTEKIITDTENIHPLSGLYDRFVIAPLGIFIAGVITIFLTRLVFYVFHPSYFDGRVPSISKSAAFAPASYVFCTGVLIVFICILITVTHVKQIYHAKVVQLALPEQERRHLLMLCNSGCYIAYMAALFLLLLSIITLEVHDPIHIILSILFFASQNLAFVYDFFCTRKINNYVRKHKAGVEELPVNGKDILFVIITCLSLFYLFMFLFKDSSIFTDNYLAHQVYTTTEYTWATLAFLYPALYYPEIRRQFSQVT